jgi:serine/threonine protein kinase
MTDRIDQQLGNYRLIQYVGGGGFADVYLGEHVHLNTLAAIKVLHTQLLASEVGRFREEARTVARLAHPNIVRVLDFGIDGTIPFLVMEYEWLCGECPFHGSPMEIWGQQLFAPPPPLREKVPMILPKVEEVILTALAKDPKQRFERVHAFASALEQAVQEELPEPATPSQEVSSSPQLTITTSLQSQGSQRKKTLVDKSFPCNCSARVSDTLCYT